MRKPPFREPAGGGFCMIAGGGLTAGSERKLTGTAP
jgi:hypothetical protein